MHESTPLLCTSYLPPIAYMAVLANHSSAIIERCETYPKQTLRNRCVIATANGVLPLTVPVVRINGNHTVTGDIQISCHEHWQTMHWRAICSAYNAAPYFQYYKDPLQRVFATRYLRLLDLNQEGLSVLLKMLKIECNIGVSKDFCPIATEEQGSDDNRSCTPTTASPRQENEITDLRNEFSIKKRYSKITFPQYYQVFDSKLGFVPNLSILDLIFNMGPEAKAYLQQLHPPREW